MESGYKILWTDHALFELESTLQYIESNFSKKELRNISKQIDSIIYLISINPYLFQESENKKGVRKAVILKYNSMYYRVMNDTIEILSFFSNRQNPDKVEL